MKVGFFAPLPPARSGIADYSAALLGALSKRGNVQVAPRQYDAGLYQLGNNQLHRQIYRQAMAAPGVSVIHDAVLQHFFLGSMTERQYVDEFAYNYGEWTRTEAATLWKDRALSGHDPRYFARPMLRRIAETSRAVVVHNPEAAARVLAHAPAAHVVEIPHFFIPPEDADPAGTVLFRGRCRYLFGVFGYLRESKRLISIVKVFARLHRALPDTGLLIAGDFHSSDLARAMEPYLSAPGVRTLGHMNDAAFSLASQAIDCCINLRFPSAGETSGIGVRMMGLGKPVIVTAGSENAALPEGSYFAVDPGIREEAHLFEMMCMLATNPEAGRETGRRAARHILRYHSLEAASEQYWKTLCDLCP